MSTAEYRAAFGVPKSLEETQASRAAAAETLGEMCVELENPNIVLSTN